MLITIVLAAALFFCGLVLSSLAEYWTHRMMHRAGLLAAAHRRHHLHASVGGVLYELCEHAKHGGPVAAAPGAIVAWTVGLVPAAAFLAGGLAWAAWAAYAHQLQHEDPGSCFWLRMPIHAVHHHHDMRHANYGVGTDVWDRIFGTYVSAAWRSASESGPPRRGPLGIRWV